MACKCADMDWSEVNKTLEHHPNCVSIISREITAQAYRDDKTFTNALSREPEPGSVLANAQPNKDVCEIFGASHLWVIVGRTFCEPDEKLAQELFEFAQYPIILSDFSKTPLDAFEHLEPGQIIHSEDVDSVKVIWDGATRYERAKQGYTTVLFACECGETRREELIGREPPVHAIPDCSLGDAWVRDHWVSAIEIILHDAANSGMDFTNARHCNMAADRILDRFFKKP